MRVSGLVRCAMSISSLRLVGLLSVDRHRLGRACSSACAARPRCAGSSGASPGAVGRRRRVREGRIAAHAASSDGASARRPRSTLLSTIVRAGSRANRRTRAARGAAPARDRAPGGPRPARDLRLGDPARISARTTSVKPRAARADREAHETRCLRPIGDDIEILGHERVEAPRPDDECLRQLVGATLGRWFATASCVTKSRRASPSALGTFRAPRRLARDARLEGSFLRRLLRRREMSRRLLAQALDRARDRRRSSLRLPTLASSAIARSADARPSTSPCPRAPARPRGRRA